MKHYEPGIHRIEASVYHADALRPCPTLSSTLARAVINRSPLHAWTAHPRLNPAYEPTERKTFDIGRAAHRAVLGAGGDYAAYPEAMLASNGAASTKEAKAWAEECRAAGIVPLKAAEVDEIEIMANAVRRKLALMKITFNPERSELTALAEVDGVWCRAMIDNAPLDPRQPLYDFKTTEDASPDAVIRSVVNYGYDVQAAFYIAAWKEATNEVRGFRFVFVEKAAPFEVAVVELHDAAGDESDWMLTAHSKAAEARRIWGDCLAANDWPGYPDRIAVIGAPAWHNQKWAAQSIGNPVDHRPSNETKARATAWQSPEGMQ